MWNAKLEGGAKLFDQSKFRLRRIGWEGRRVRLELGLTGYKEYIGTHRRPEKELKIGAYDGAFWRLRDLQT